MASENNEIDLSELFRRVWRGLPLTLALGCFGAVIGLASTWQMSRIAPVETSMRVAFSFPGFERGEYPDGSKFQPDDLRAPDLVEKAIKRLDTRNDPELQSLLRGSVSVSGIIPPNVSKERDRLRASGQNVPPYIADEYQVSLLLPATRQILPRERELFLNELTVAFRERFTLLYAEAPAQFGGVFATLKNSDYFEYEIALNQEIQNLRGFLTIVQERARAFRSPTTGLTFNDLSSQLQLFSQLKLTDTLALINSVGLTGNRTIALRKIGYYIRTLSDDERRLSEEEQVVNNLLTKAQDRGQSYVLSSKVQSDANKMLVSENLLDALVANDAYNFLIKKALDSGLRLQQMRARKEQAAALKERIEAFVEQNASDRTILAEQVTKSLSLLEADYRQLTNNIRSTYQDYSHQQFADAVRITMQPTGSSSVRVLFISSIAGLLAGGVLGLGLSFIERGFGRRR